MFTFGCNHLGNSISNQRTVFAVCGLHIMCTLYNFNFQSSMDVISRCPNFQFFFRNKMLTGGIWINFFWQSFQQFVISFRSQKVVAYHTLQVTLWSSAILNRSQNKKRAQKLKWRRKIRAWNLVVSIRFGGCVSYLSFVFVMKKPTGKKEHNSHLSNRPLMTVQEKKSP